MVTDPSSAIYMKSSFGPTFGAGHDIKIADMAHGNVHSFTKFGVSYKLPRGTSDPNTILAGTHNFTPDKVEVFYLT